MTPGGLAATCPDCGAPVHRVVAKLSGRPGVDAGSVSILVNTHEEIAGPDRFVERDGVYVPVSPTWQHMAFVRHRHD